jgi:uncharacterized membrane protein
MVSGIGFIAVSSRETLEVRLLVLIGIFVFAFFKFTWSLRQFTHADAVRFGADAGGEGCAGPGRFRAGIDAGAMMVTHGFASFNRGLRAYFFGLAALAWFIQPWAFVLATSWVVAVLYWARQPFGDAGDAGRAGDGEGAALRRGWRFDRSQTGRFTPLRHAAPPERRLRVAAGPLR